MNDREREIDAAAVRPAHASLFPTFAGGDCGVHHGGDLVVVGQPEPARESVELSAARIRVAGEGHLAGRVV